MQKMQMMSMTVKTGRQNAALTCRKVALLFVAGLGASMLAAAVIENWDKGLTNKGVKDVLDFVHGLLG